MATAPTLNPVFARIAQGRATQAESAGRVVRLDDRLPAKATAAAIQPHRNLMLRRPIGATSTENLAPTLGDDSERADQSQSEGAASSPPVVSNFLELARKRLLDSGRKPRQGHEPAAQTGEVTTLASADVVVAVPSVEPTAPEPELVQAQAVLDSAVAEDEAGASLEVVNAVNADQPVEAPLEQATQGEPTVQAAVPTLPRRVPMSPMAGGLARIAKRAQDLKQQRSEQVATEQNLVQTAVPVRTGGDTVLKLAPRPVGAAQADDDWDDPNADAFTDDSTDDDDVSELAQETVLEEVSGVLNSVRVFNDWAIGSLWTQDREEVRLTGSALSGLTEGLEYTFRGVTKASKYGEALEVSAYEPVISVDPKALERYMVKSFKGVGPVKAQKYIAGLMESARSAMEEQSPQASESELSAAATSALDDLRDKLLHRPWEIDLTSLASKAKLEDGHDPQEAAKLVVLTRNLMLRLGAQKGFKESVAKSLSVYLLDEIAKDHSKEGDGSNPGLLGVDLVEASWTKLVTNPYKPIRKAAGYSFGTAEVIASFVGIPKDAGMRLAALSEYAVEQACQRKGHTYLGAKDFLSAVQKVDPAVNAQKALTYAISEKLLIAELATKRLYTPKLHEAERNVAKNLAKLLEPAEPLTARSAQDVKRKLIKDAPKINAAFKDGLDEMQLEAVASMLTAPTRLHVLTGGPGTGKTSIIECAVHLLKKKSFQFTAPTGKAAKVLSSRVKSMGHSASTVHSLLKGGPEDGFMVNEDAPLDCDVLVVDESTMNGIELADALLRAIKNDAHVIFLGDPGKRAGADGPGRAGQLPSISPGRFMMDLLELPGVNHVNLTKTHRNSGGILEVVNEIRDGALEVRDRDAVRFHGLPTAGVGFAGVKQEYIECVMRDGVESTLLVMPKRQGDKSTADWNTTYANAVLRDVLNPQGLKLPGTTLATGDRVLIRQNLKIEQPSGEEKRSLRLGASLAMPGVALPLGFDPDRLAPLRQAGRVSDHPSGLDFEALAKASDGFADDDETSQCAAMPDDQDVNVERVVNGDTGTIIGYSMDPRMPRVGTPKWIHIALDDGRLVDLPGEEMACLDFAYALTVHSAQGSEYKNVIMVVTPGSADFMNQNMIFTGFSRAKTHLSVYADERDLIKTAATAMPDRNSALISRVAEITGQNENISEDNLPTELPA